MASRKDQTHEGRILDLLTDIAGDVERMSDDEVVEYLDEHGPSSDALFAAVGLRMLTIMAHLREQSTTSDFPVDLSDRRTLLPKRKRTL